MDFFQRVAQTNKQENTKAQYYSFLVGESTSNTAQGDRLCGVKWEGYD